MVIICYGYYSATPEYLPLLVDSQGALIVVTG